MNNAVLIDTNIASYMFNRHSLIELYLPHIQYRRMLVSHLTVEEMFYGAYKNNWDNRRKVELFDFVDTFTVVYPDELMTRTCAYIRASLRSQSIELHDAMIAATAIVQDIPLVSHNARHFRDVPGLDLITEHRA